MSVTPTPALDQVEQRALDVARATYEAVRRADVLDSRDHWDRFANRLQSAAYAPDGGEYLAQVARRFRIPHTPGDAFLFLLSLPESEQREVLRVVRRRSNALSVLVRSERDAARNARRES